MKNHPPTKHPSVTYITLVYKEPNESQPRDLRVPLPATLGRDPSNTVVLPGQEVSRDHARLEEADGQIRLLDQQSGNGTLVNGQRNEKATLQVGDVIQIGNYHLVIKTLPTVTEADKQSDDDHTLIFHEQTDNLGALRPAVLIDESFPPPFFRQQYISSHALQKSNWPIKECTYLTIGAGLGSFVWGNLLAVCGADPSQMMAIGVDPKPYNRYRQLCQNSQIPEHERLRSDSSSCPGNLWGWPGYAPREAGRAFFAGDVAKATRILWQIFNEPTFAETYTPRSGDVYAEIEREATRIGWANIWQQGRVKAIRKTDDGRYAIAYTTTDRGASSQRIVLAKYVHSAVGYPAIRLLPDLFAYRQSTGDFKSVVNAYEEHEHVYAQLRQKGGVVLVRGRGIVASRIIQRLYEVREHNKQIAILHLLRDPILQGNRFEQAQRLVAHHWETQPFNWPKACWGGILRVLLENASEQERKRLLEIWGDTTTADRQDWMNIVAQGLHEGWYQQAFGEVQKVEQTTNHQLITYIRGTNGVKGQLQLKADFIIDATGLESKIDANPLLKDLLDHYQLERNVLGRLKVTNDFEVAGMQNDGGRMFASGAMTLGGPYAAVDSFLGLQFAALRSVDAMVALGAPGLHYLDGWRSLIQWVRWMKGVKP